MTTTHHTPIVVGASNHPDTVNDPLGQLDAAIGAEAAARVGGDNALDTRIDTLIIGSGTSSAEVVDARVAGHTDGVSPSVLSKRMEWIAANAYHPMAYGAVGDGVTNDKAAIDAAIAAIGAARGYLLIDRPYKIGANLNIVNTGALSQVAVVFQPGGMFVIPDGVMVVFRGPVIAGLYKIFDIGGDVVASPATARGVSLSHADIDYVYPEWFGAHEDADATPALLRTIYAAFNRQTIRATGVYVVQRPIDLNTAYANQVRWAGTVRGGVGAAIVAVESGYTVTINERSVTGGGFTGDYLFRINGSSYIHIDGLTARLYGAINNSNLTLFALQGVSAALELSYLRNVSLDAYKNAQVGSPNFDVGPTIKHFLGINGAGPLLIENLNIMYGNWVTPDNNPTEYGAVTDYPVSIICTNGLTIRNVNYMMTLNPTHADNRGVYLRADSWCIIDGWWFENPVGAGIPNFVITANGRGAVQMRGVRFKTGRKIAAGDHVLIEYAQYGNHTGWSDWDLTQIYWETALAATDTVLRIKNGSGVTLATYLAGDLNTDATPTMQGVAHLSRHALKVNGYSKTLNSGRTRQIDQLVGDVTSGSTFDIYHDAQLTPIATNFVPGCYLLMIAARTGGSASAGYLAFVDFYGTSPSVNVTELVGAPNWSVAYEASTGRFRVTNTTGGTLHNVGYSVIEFTQRNQFVNV